MHAPQGVFTHTNDETCKVIQSIENNGPWMDSVRSVRDEAADILKTDNDFNRLHQQSTSYDQAIKQKQKSKQFQQNQGQGTNQVLMAQYDAQIENLRTVKKEHSESTVYGRKTLLIRGAEEVVSAIKAYESSSKKYKGPAEYAFDSAQIHYGKASFNAQHGGKEMAHKHGIQVLENWSKVADATIAVYTEEENPQLQNALKTLFQCVKRITEPLLTMSKILKSQSKIQGQRLRTLQRALVSLSKAWREVFEDANVFLKLHHIEFQVWTFVVANEMYGRLSEEAFESCHPIINDLQQVLSGMVGTQQRMKTFSRRMNARTNDEVQRIIDDVEEKTNGTARCTYKKNRDVSDDDLDYIKCGTIVSSENGYLQLSSGSLIPESWKEVYLLCANNEVPQKWHHVFEDDEDLGEETKQKAKYAC